MKKLLYINTISTNDKLDKGVKLKIAAQLKALKKLGYKIDYLERKNEKENYWFELNGKELKGARFQRRLFSQLIEYFKYPVLKKLEIILNFQKYEIIYFRRFVLTYGSLKFIKKLKSEKKIWEIPTYPYDKEEINIKGKLLNCFEKIYFRRKLLKNIDKIVTYSEDKIIWNIPCINISNGIDLEEVNLIEKNIHSGINFISVANYSFWHGIDRFLYSLLQYRKNCGKDKIIFNIIGEGAEIPKLKKIIEDNIELQDIVIFHGFKSGKDLDKIYNDSDIAVGSLGRFRSGLNIMKSLKNREYCAKGLPMIYSETDLDFEGKNFVYKVSHDESLIDIEKIIKWYKNLKVSSNEIREYSKKFSWDIQMKKVLDEIKEL